MPRHKLIVNSLLVRTGVACIGFAICLHAAQAEPYIAVSQGLKCAACHTNPSGGGKRNEYGNLFAQTTLAADYKNFTPRMESGESPARWNGTVNQYLGLGADFRGELLAMDIPGQDDRSEFVYEESLLYVELIPIPGVASLYIDQKLGPGDSVTREAYGLVRPRDGRYYIKAGRFFLPFGLRLEDDEALTRSLTGISFDTPDDGVEFGYEGGNWSSQIAISNGAGGAAETDQDKRISFNTSYVKSQWRVGVSINSNDAAALSRDMFSLYAGWQSGSVSWLAEYDEITDQLLAGTEIKNQVGLLEANILLSKGSNLKLSYEKQRPDQQLAIDDKSRMSLVWEYFPMQYTQMSLGYRSNDADPTDPVNGRDQVFAQLHLFF